MTTYHSMIIKGKKWSKRYKVIEEITDYITVSYSLYTPLSLIELINPI